MVHPDYQGCAVPRDPRVLDALRRTFAELEEYQRELGVRIVVENLPGVGFSHFGAPGDLDLGELGLILDTGHAAICGTLHDFLREPHAELAHVHLHDNRGPADAGDPHLPLGRGVVDARAVLRAARASGATVILELLDEAAIRESIAHLERRDCWTAGARTRAAPPAAARRRLDLEREPEARRPGTPAARAGCPARPACASPWYSRGATSLGPSGYSRLASAWIWSRPMPSSNWPPP